MRRKAVLTFAVAWALSVSVTTAGAQSLPTCRVRAVRSRATDAAPKAVFAQVEAWVDARERGVRLVPSVEEADLLLEFRDYGTKTMDGTPAEEWLFVARRLSEPDVERAIYRFGYVTFLDRRTKAHVARTMPTVLADLCFGYLPTLAPRQK